MLTEPRERIRASIPMSELCSSSGVILRRSGSRFIGPCPFHEERTASFVTGGRFPDRAHCFGCGWDGDIFKFWQERRGCDFATALRELGAMAGVHIDQRSADFSPCAFKPLQKSKHKEEPHEKPHLPPLRRLKDAEVAQLARIRGLSVDAVACAAYRFQRIGYADWPQFHDERTHDFRLPTSHFPSWCLTDSTRNTAEFRRLDGEKYTRADGGEIKAWSTKGKSWPIGAADMGTRRCILLVEGGPDVLAAYHFLHRFGMLDSVAVVGVLGAANRIREDALTYFTGARVRIMMDEDPAGRTASVRWSEQLIEAGSAVQSVYLGGLRRADGMDAKDLNDLALCNEDITDSDDIAEIFTDWKTGFGG